MASKKESILLELQHLQNILMEQDCGYASKNVGVVNRAIEYIKNTPAFVAKTPSVSKYENESLNKKIKEIVYDIIVTKNLCVYYSTIKDLSLYVSREYSVPNGMAKKIAWIIINLNTEFAPYIKDEFGIDYSKN